jgi:hypothetical protein
MDAPAAFPARKDPLEQFSKKDCGNSEKPLKLELAA